MYFIKWLLKFLCGATLILLLIWLSLRVYFWLTSAESVALRSEEETRSTVHWLKQDKPLIFNFSPDRTFSIRVLSNAIFSQQNQFDKPVNYAIEFTLLDSKGQSLSTNIYHHASKLALDIEDKQVKQIIENRDTLAVSSGQSFFISNEQLTNASAIAMRLVPENMLLRGVVIRLHAKTPVSSNDLDRAWLKQSTEWRERMMSYHTIGENAISGQEILNAVTFEWQKLAPQGIPGIDFTSDTLYETLPYYVLNYDFSVEQLNLDGFYTDSKLKASFRNYLSQDLFIHSEDDITHLFVTWFDLKQLSPSVNLKIDKTELDGVYKIPAVDQGLIVFQSNVAFLTRWFAEDNTPFGTLNSYFYHIDNEQDLIYNIAQNSDVKFEFRGENGTAVNIFLYNNDIELERYRVFLEGNIAYFDRVIDEATLRQAVFDAEAFYLRLPDNVNRINISSKTPVLARLQARQSTFHYQLELCEQVCKSNIEGFFPIDTWFSQKAQNEYIFTEQQKITNVRLFEMPPEVPEFKTTTYLSRDLSGDLTLSNNFLVNAPEEYFFKAYPKKEPTEYQFKEVISNQQLVNASFNNQRRDKRVIEVFDEPPFYKEQALEEIANISTYYSSEVDNRSLFINDGETRQWQKQRSYFLKAGMPLKIPYELIPESVVIKAISTQTISEHLLIDTQIEGQFTNGLVSEYTTSKKRYALKPASLTKAFALHPKLKNVTTFNSITLTIGEDVKALKSISITSENDVWISVFDELNETPSEAIWRQYESE